MDSKHTHLLFLGGYSQYSVSGLLIFRVSSTLCLCHCLPAHVMTVEGDGRDSSSSQLRLCWEWQWWWDGDVIVSKLWETSIVNYCSLHCKNFTDTIQSAHILLGFLDLSFSMPLIGQLLPILGSNWLMHFVKLGSLQLLMTRFVYTKWTI